MRPRCSPPALPRCVTSLLAAVLVVILLAYSSPAQSTGSWTGLQNLPYRPVHVSLLPNGKVLMYSYYAESLSPFVWDPATSATTPAATAPYELFCAGHAVMADGRVFIVGGHIADYTGYTHVQLYDPQKNTYTATPDMNAGRWYPTPTVLPNGDMLVVSGDMTSNTSPNPLPQVYQLGSNSWRNLTSAQLQMPLYPTMIVAPDGRVFNAGPAQQTRWLTTSGTGAWALGPAMIFGGTRDYAPVVLYENGKMLAVGGSDPPTATAETLDLTAASPAWKATASMHYARRQHNAVVLPDGKVFVSGGSNGAGFDNSAAPVYPTEMWDPATGQWTVMASIAAYRGYHSTSLLLPDGRVFEGGGNVGGPNFQIFSPPYLSAGARPTISSAPTQAGYGQGVFVGTPNATSITKVSLIRMPSVTHTLDSNQRFMTLAFSQASGGLTVTFPANANLAPPGHYMLFLLNSAGVPSVAAIVQIAAGAAPTTGTINGVVTSTSGAPLGGTNVVAGAIATTTLSDGTYTLANVPAGAVTVTASLSGYSSASASVTVTAAASVTAPTLQLAPVSPGNVSGTVVSSTGGAIAGATVSGRGLTTTTAADGSYMLTGLPAGATTLTASATGYSSSTASVTVTAGTTITAPVITLTPNIGSVTGTVTDSNGAAIAGASVGFGGGTTTTNASGVYTLSGIAAGTIQLVASATGYTSQTQNVTIVAGATVTANYSLAAAPANGLITGKVTNIQTNASIGGATVSWDGGSTTADSTGTYTLNNVVAGTQNFTATATGYVPRTLSATVVGGTTTTLNIPLATGALLNVVVKNTAGAALVGAAVTASGGLVATTVSGTTGTTGAYLTPWIPIGSYAVTVSLAGYLTQTVNATGNTGATTTVNVTLASGAGGTIAGTVQTSAGAAIAGATVSYAGGTTTTSSTGAYTLANVAPGAVQLTASASGYASQTQSVSVTSGATTTANFTLLAVSGTGSITGKVANISTGGALSGATVSWSGGSATTNSLGVYTLSNVTPGTLNFTATATGYIPRTLSATVVAGTTTTLNLPLSTGALINVVVKNASGAVVSGAAVTVSGGVVATAVSGTTNASGVYLTPWIPIGTYTVTISLAGHTTQTKTATATTGATTTVSVTGF